MFPHPVTNVQPAQKELTSIEAQGLKARIRAALDEHEWFGAISKRLNVTWDVVNALAFSLTTEVCAKCAGRGLTKNRDDKPVRCERCKGSGYL